MPRFFTEIIGEREIILDGENATHISRSLRAKIGDELIVCDGKGTDYKTKIVSIDNSTVTAEIIDSHRCVTESPCRITLFQAMPKSDKFELIVQKAVELGVYEIVPVLTEFCVSRPDEKSFNKKLDRYQKIALEAAKQCGRGIIPIVRNIMGYKECIAKMQESETSIMFYENATSALQKELLPQKQSLSVLIGSEGGFSTKEVDFAKENNIKICTMGNRILRCETASFYALSAISYQYENCGI